MHPLEFMLDRCPSWSGKTTSGTGIEVTGDDLVNSLAMRSAMSVGSSPSSALGQAADFEDSQGLGSWAAPHEGLAADIEVVQARRVWAPSSGWRPPMVPFHGVGSRYGS